MNAVAELVQKGFEHFGGSGDAGAYILRPKDMREIDFQRPLPFGGREGFDAVFDGKRLTAALQKVYDLMSDGRFRTLREIADAVHCSESGAGARLRDLRKSWAGSHTVERKRIKESGLWLYRLVIG